MRHHERICDTNALRFFSLTGKQAQCICPPVPPRVSWDDLVCYIEHPSPHLGRQPSPHSAPPQAHP